MRPTLTESLTQRELDVLDLLDLQFSCEKIATVLDISSETVRHHTCDL